MIDRYEKHCPYCDARSPLGTPCSAECEKKHARYRAHEKLWKSNVILTVAVCILYLLLSDPREGRWTLWLCAGWAVWLCIAQMVFPYSRYVIGGEKKTERRMRTTGLIALVLFGVFYTLLFVIEPAVILDLLFGRGG